MSHWRAAHVSPIERFTALRSWGAVLGFVPLGVLILALLIF